MARKPFFIGEDDPFGKMTIFPGRTKRILSFMPMGYTMKMTHEQGFEKTVLKKEELNHDSQSKC